MIEVPHSIAYNIVLLILMRKSFLKITKGQLKVGYASLGKGIPQVVLNHTFR